MKIKLIILPISYFISFNLIASTVDIDCPKIEVNNPYTILKNPGDGWQIDNTAKSYLNCNKHINPQGFLKCAYKASAHSTVNTYALKRKPPANMSCKPKEILCGFTCTGSPNRLKPKLKSPKKNLK